LPTIDIDPRTAEGLAQIAAAKPRGLQAVGLNGTSTGSCLDAKAATIAGLAALIALDGPPAAYGELVAQALEAELSADEIVATLHAVAPVIGSARVVAAAPEIMLALGLPLPGTGAEG
jgi:4-carboxymuconolactone decarboxylase